MMTNSTKGNAALRVAAYTRVSTRQDRQEGSLALQREWFEYKYAGDPAMQLIAVYHDDTSGTELTRRKGFRSMLADCEAGKIDLIVTKSVSRFSRNMGDCLRVVRWLSERNIGVLFENDGVCTLGDEGELILSIFAAVAQEEINALSCNLSWALHRRDASGKPNYRVSYGYRKEETGWTICEREAWRVRLAFELAAEGATYRQIAEELNALEQTDPTGAKWTQRRLYALFHNEHYLGDVLTQKTYLPDYLTHRRARNKGEREQYYLEGHHAPIVSRERYESVQLRVKAGLLRSNRRGAEVTL